MDPQNQALVNGSNSSGIPCACSREEMSVFNMETTLLGVPSIETRILSRHLHSGMPHCAWIRSGVYGNLEWINSATSGAQLLIF